MSMFNRLLDSLNNKSEEDKAININIDTVNHNTDEDINELMIKIAAQMRLNNLGRGVR